MAHIFVFDGHGAFAPDGRVNVDRAEADRLNAETTAKELAFWATAPEQFAPAYYSINRRVVTTWTGSVLGAIVDHNIYSHNFGGQMISMTVQGNNGATYYGRASYSNGEVVRLRKVTR